MVPMVVSKNELLLISGNMPVLFGEPQQLHFIFVPYNAFILVSFCPAIIFNISAVDWCSSGSIWRSLHDAGVCQRLRPEQRKRHHFYSTQRCCVAVLFSVENIGKLLE